MVDKVKYSMKQVRISRRFNALITDTFDLAQEQCAEHLKRGRNVFAMIVKDNFAVENVPMTCASAMLSNYKAPYTATVVDRLFKRGGCLIGKANMDEFAMGSSNVDSHFGPVKHPRTPSNQFYDDFYVAGGSSGGCAVAIKEFMCDLAIGSDTGGSTRNPASFNGVVGFKPSYGLVSRAGLVPLANSFDSPSFFTRTVDSCVRYFEYTLGRDPLDCTTIDPPPKSPDDQISIDQANRLKIAIPREFFDADLTKDCKRLWADAVKLLTSVGAQLIPVSLPHTKHSAGCYHILNESDVFSNMARYDSIRFGNCVPDKNALAQQLISSRNDALNSVVRRRIFAGNYFNLEENKGKYFLQAAKIRRLIQQDFDRIFGEQKYDAILVPSTNSSAPKISEVKAKSLKESRNDDFFTQSANMCGLPAISVPFGACSNQMPIGMQFICSYLSDRKCLALGKILHELAISSSKTSGSRMRMSSKNY